MATAIAKKQRTTAKQQFTRKVNICNELANNKDGIHEVEASFADVCNAWKLVEQRHSEYVVLLDEDTTTDEEWIQGEEKNTWTIVKPCYHFVRKRKNGSD